MIVLKNNILFLSDLSDLLILKNSNDLPSIQCIGSKMLMDSSPFRHMHCIMAASVSTFFDEIQGLHSNEIHKSHVRNMVITYKKSKKLFHYFLFPFVSQHAMILTHHNFDKHLVTAFEDSPDHVHVVNLY